MKTGKRVLIALVLAILIPGAPVIADTITLIADEWCPYNCAPDSDQPGYMIEIAKSAFEKAGHTVDYQTMNWSRSITETRDGKYTAIVGASTGDAPDFIFPGIHMGIMSNVFWVKTDRNWTFTGMDSLKDATIGLIQDYDYGAFTAFMEANPNQIEFNRGDDALEKNIRKLELDRLTTILEDGNVFQNKAQEMGKLDLFKSAGEYSSPNEEDYLYIAFSPANPLAKEYADLLAQEIKVLRESGKLKDILGKYGLKDWEK